MYELIDGAPLCGCRRGREYTRLSRAPSATTIALKRSVLRSNQMDFDNSLVSGAAKVGYFILFDKRKETGYDLPMSSSLCTDESRLPIQFRSTLLAMSLNV